MSLHRWYGSTAEIPAWVTIHLCTLQNGLACRLVPAVAARGRSLVSLPPPPSTALTTLAVTRLVTKTTAAAYELTSTDLALSSDDQGQARYVRS